MNAPVNITVKGRSNFWWGFIAGACFMAAMDIGDVWLCMGECGDVPARILTEPSND